MILCPVVIVFLNVIVVLDCVIVFKSDSKPIFSMCCGASLIHPLITTAFSGIS